MTEPTRTNGFLEIAPVDFHLREGGALAHSLAVLRTVPRYNAWVYRACRPFVGGRVLEVGAGLGSITRFLLSAEQVVCLEPFAPFREYLQQAVAKHPNIRIRPETIEECPSPDVPAGGFDTVLCVNVLEHVADDAGAVRRMRELLRPGGRLVILSPAAPCLFGRMDEALGHLRRYTRRGLVALCKNAGLAVLRSRHMNLCGALGWWWAGRVMKRQHISAPLAQAFDRVVPLVSAVERVIPPPWGQSALVVGRKETA